MLLCCDRNLGYAADVEEMSTEPSPLVSVIILNYNGGNYIQRCLYGVLSTDYPNFEIIVVDNASRDRSIDIIVRLLSNCSRPYKIIKNDRNHGFAEGNNIGLAASHGEYVVFLNNDTEVDRFWLKELVRIGSSDPTIGVVQSKLLRLSDHRIFDSAGDYIDHYGTAFRRGGEWREVDTGQYDDVQEVFSARGAAMLVKRTVLDEIGPFDPKFFLTVEDIDLCWRARLAGYKVMYAPTSVVYHICPCSSNPLLRMYHARKNTPVLLIKNYSFSNLLRYLTMRILIYSVSILKSLFVAFLSTDHMNVFLTRLRAVTWVITHLRYVLRQRSICQYRVRRVPDTQIVKFMLNTTLKEYTWLLVKSTAKAEHLRMEAARQYFNRGYTRLY